MTALCHTVRVRLCSFADSFVRKHAVTLLRRLSADEVYDLLPQLVQVRDLLEFTWILQWRSEDGWLRLEPFFDICVGPDYVPFTYPKGPIWALCLIPTGCIFQFI